MNFFRFYLIVFGITFFSPVLDFLFYLNNVDVIFLSKFPFVFLFVISVVFHFKRKIFFDSTSKIFLMALFLSLVFFVFYSHNLNSAFFSHFYALVMPIFSISMGFYFHKKYLQDLFLQMFTHRILVVGFWISLLLTGGYVYFYFIAKQWGYFGFGTNLPIVIGYFFIKNPRLAFFGMLVNFFSGKRTGILISIVQFLRSINIKSLYKKPIFSVLVLLFFTYSISLLKKFELLKRFELILEFDVDDAYLIFISTGGRLTEVVSLFNYWIDYPIRFFTGSGLGAKFLFEDPRIDFADELMHYTHFSPSFYIFLVGFPLTFILYISILNKVKFISKEEPLTLIFLSFFLSSFFGSIMFIDPRFWFFFGILVSYKKYLFKIN
jgi:hypothetical protein